MSKKNELNSLQIKELLRYFIRNNVKLSENMIKQITYQILKGLNSIHNKNLLHRDMKPENVFIDG